MRILFYFGHPSQYLFLRKSIQILKKKDNKLKILIKSKDVLEDLLKADGIEYINILPEIRGRYRFSIFFNYIKRIYKIFPIFIKFKPDLTLSTDPSLTQISSVFGKGRITFLEDDYDLIKALAKLSFPFTQYILCPDVCKVGNWNIKKIGYYGYMKLGYLHPNVFIFDESVLERYGFSNKYVILRLSKLSAYHDFGINGINISILDRLISFYEEKSFNVLISSEGIVDFKYKKYLLDIKPKDIHHILAGSSFLVCDSQSMTVEAAMLGIPSIRISSFAGKISVLEELEHRYKLTFAINPKNVEDIFFKIEELLNIQNIKEIFQMRREKMLDDKIDVTSFLVWFIENYPNSAHIITKNQEYQYRFK